MPAGCGLPYPAVVTLLHDEVGAGGRACGDLISRYSVTTKYGHTEGNQSHAIVEQMKRGLITEVMG